MDDAVRLTRDTLQTGSANMQNTLDTLHALLAEITVIEASSDSREPVILQQVGLVLTLLPELVSVREEINHL